MKQFPQWYYTMKHYRDEYGDLSAHISYRTTMGKFICAECVTTNTKDSDGNEMELEGTTELPKTGFKACDNCGFHMTYMASSIVVPKVKKTAKRVRQEVEYIPE
jgi:peptide subunit release factor 1 (eRF1)